VNLPDGCGLDLVPTILSRKPGASIIVMTADPRPEHRQRSCHLGIHHFIPKPIEAEALREAARNSVGRSGSTDQPPLFSASLKGVSLFDIVQLKCLSRASCRLEVFGAEPGLRFGAIDFARGEIIHAEVRDPPLEKLDEGEEALEQILSWSQGNIEDLAASPQTDRTIQVPWQMLLLTAAQRTDENRVAGASGFQPAAGYSCREAPPQASQLRDTTLTRRGLRPGEDGCVPRVLRTRSEAPPR